MVYRARLPRPILSAQARQAAGVGVGMAVPWTDGRDGHLEPSNSLYVNVGASIQPVHLLYRAWYVCVRAMLVVKDATACAVGGGCWCVQSPSLLV